MKILMFLLLFSSNLIAQDLPCNNLKDSINKAEYPLILYSGYLQYLHFVFAEEPYDTLFTNSLETQFLTVSSIFTDDAFIAIEFDKIGIIVPVYDNLKNPNFFPYYVARLTEDAIPKIHTFSISNITIYQDYIYYDSIYYTIAKLETEIQFSLMSNHIGIMTCNYFARLDLTANGWKIRYIYPDNTILTEKYIQERLILNCK